MSVPYFVEGQIVSAAWLNQVSEALNSMGITPPLPYFTDGNELPASWLNAVAAFLNGPTTTAIVGGDPTNPIFSVTQNTTQPTNREWIGGSFQTNLTGTPVGYGITLKSYMSNTGQGLIGATETHAEIATYSVPIRFLPEGGYAPGYMGLDQWMYWGQNIDTTFLPSSQGGAMLSEFDTSANDRDDAGRRSGQVHIFNEWHQVGVPLPDPFTGKPSATGGLPAQFASGWSMTTNSAYTCIHRMMTFAASYSDAILEMRLAKQMVGTIQETADAGATTLHVSNVVAYMSGGAQAIVTSPTNPLSVTIGANDYLVSDAQYDAPAGDGTTTDKGTLTLTTPIIGTDGAAGNEVVGLARTIWMDMGHTIGFSNSPDNYIGVMTPGILSIVSTITQCKGILTVSGNAGVGGSLQASGTFAVGPQAGPGSSIFNMLSSGNGQSNPDSSIRTMGGTGHLDGTMSITAGQVLMPTLAQSASYADNAAAATGGVPLWGLYRNGSVVQIRNT